MDNQALARYIDLTLLKPEASIVDIEALCAKAIEHGVYAVCVNPYRVAHAAMALKGTNVLPISVVGFPLGSTDPVIKCFETAFAVEEGAREIDMVMNIGAFKDGNLEAVRHEIAEVLSGCEGHPLKVIIESATLTEAGVGIACDLALQAGAQFVKTSTGFHPNGGATLEAVRIMREAVGDKLGVKASGGIKTRDHAFAMIEAGATRLGVSDVSQILV